MYQWSKGRGLEQARMEMRMLWGGDEMGVRVAYAGCGRGEMIYTYMPSSRSP